MNKNLITSTILTIFLCMGSCGCSKSSESDNGGGSIPGTTVMKPKYSKSKILRNPLNGWVMYASRTSDSTFWNNTKIYVPDLGKTVKVSDYASACYIRTSWSSLNPADGVYAWNDPSSRLGQLILAAEKNGLPIAFRIVVDGRDQGANTPDFVFDAGAQYYLESETHPTWKTPYPQDTVFQRYYTKFIEAFAARFNDPDRTAFIDAYGLGKWGEGHHVVYEPGNVISENTERLKEEVMEWITSLYARTFTKVPLVINYHRLIGHPASSGTPNPNSEKLLTIAINKGYSLRSDAFGMNDYYGAWEKAFASTWVYKRPIIMEGGWIVSSHSYWNDPAGYRQGHPEDVRQGEFDSSAEAHVNMMDFRVGNETETWFTLCYNLVQRFISEGGYRLYPDQVALPEKVAAGATAKISHRWRNMGWGYFPNNIPQWNYKYKVAFALLDANDKVVEEVVDPKCEPSGWLKSSPTAYTSDFQVTAPIGNYTWAVAIVDTQKSNKPAIKLALNETETAEGWVKLLAVKVN